MTFLSTKSRQRVIAVMKQNEAPRRLRILEQALKEQRLGDHALYDRRLGRQRSAHRIGLWWHRLTFAFCRQALPGHRSVASISQAAFAKDHPTLLDLTAR